MGSITVRNDKLTFDFRYRGLRCREQSKLDDTKVNRKRLEQILKRIESEITLGQFVYKNYFPNSKRVEKFNEIEAKKVAVRLSEGLEEVDQASPHFSEFALLWLSEKKIEWRESNYATVEDVLNLHLLPVFGDKKLSDIKKADILNFRSTLAKVTGRTNGKLSASRINHIMTPLRVIMNEAAERFEFTSPWKNIKALPVPRTDIKPFTLDQVQLFLTNVRPDFRCYFLTRFFTGLRTSEVDGLLWTKIDFKTREIHIHQALVKGKLIPTKTDGSYRTIQMSEFVYNALLAHKKAVGHRSQYVFSTANGTHLQNRYISRHVWYPTLAKCYLEKRNPYQTRHTAATLWLAAGESPEWIAYQMGHSSTTMLFRVYSRFVPNLTRQDGSAFERLLISKFPELPMESN